MTYFFSGGKEDILPGEERVVIPSPRDVATYDLRPQMSAEAVTDAFCTALQDKRFDVYIVNYANGDMVGHTGDFDATCAAVETVDACLARVLEALERADGTAAVTADHGNADQMLDYDTGEPHTYHTLHPVPFCLVGHNLGSVSLASDGSLCDIAPTLCALADLEQPSEMSGRSLIR